MKVTFLKPIRETTEDYEAIEKQIRDYFKKYLYLPMLRELEGPSKTLKNAKAIGLYEAIRTGRITFHRGVFSGRFNSEISRDLQKLGARFDRRTATYRISVTEIPRDLRHAISSSRDTFERKIQKIDDTLSQILPENFAGLISTEKHFDRALWRVDRDFKQSVKGITIAPELTPEARKRIAAEWSHNMQLWIKDFTVKEIKNLRENMEKTVFSGNRYGSAIQAIQDSYGVTKRKAKFLARQETMLLMTKFKQVRYEDAGVVWYRWKCVAGSKLHPVRKWHKIHEDKFFRWDKPPQTDAEGNHKNPGQDYNCRCAAIPMVNYKGS